MSRDILAAGSAPVSEMMAALASRLQRPFHHAKALYRFLANPRVRAEALLERVSRESALAPQGEEVLIFLDLSLVHKPHARRLARIGWVGRKRETGCALVTTWGWMPRGGWPWSTPNWWPTSSGGLLACPRGASSAAWGKLGIASEQDRPYLLLPGLVHLLNYEITGKTSAVRVW